MRRSVAIVLGALIVGASFGVMPAWACSCVAASTQQHVERAGVVFVGRALVVDDTPDGITATFDVQEVYKGSLPESVPVNTASDEASCGIVFVPGERYSVFARVEDRELTTGLCDGTETGSTSLAAAGFTEPIARNPTVITAETPEPQPGRRAGPIAAALVLITAAVLGHLLRTRWRHHWPPQIRT